MLLVATTSSLLVLGLVAPAAAQDVGAPTDNFETVEVRPEVRPHVRPEVRPHVRPEIEALSLGCQARRDADGNLGAACRWSTTDTARGYQLWRLVDRGHRELVGTYDAETNVARDDVPNDARLARYTVLALDGDGDIIGRSRFVGVRFGQVDTPKVNARRANTEVRPVELVQRPINIGLHRPVQVNGLMFVGPV